jgi:hypothetical protein
MMKVLFKTFLDFIVMLAVVLLSLLIALSMIWALRFGSQKFADVFPPNVILNLFEIAVIVSVLFAAWRSLAEWRDRKSR